MKSLKDAVRVAADRAHEIHAEGLDEDASARIALGILADAELLAWGVPAAWGGRATNCAPDQVSVAELSELRAGLAHASGMLDVMLAMQGLGSYPLARAGSDGLRAEILPGVISGERIAAFALTEPDAGSDLNAIATTAEKDGAGWRLNGRKTFISNAGLADFYTILARTSGEPGSPAKRALSMFFLPAETPGLQVERFEVMAPHPIGDLLLEDVALPAASLLGEEGRGLGIALATLGRFRTTVAAAANGFSRRALDESIARLKGRRQFGKALSEQQGLQFDLAEMDARLRASELLVREAAQAVDAGLPATLEVARAKLVSTENACWICDRAVQHFGGLGVRRGIIVERLFREVRALRIYEGTSEIQKLIISRELLR